MYVVTGSAGFIGSCVAADLIRQDRGPVVLVDDFGRPASAPNWEGLRCRERVDREAFWNWIEGREREIRAVVHLGARTDTAEQDRRVLDRLNLDYSRRMWDLCARHGIPLLYASSAATYGDGSLGFDDDHALIPRLVPLNPYGESKHEFDRWVLTRTESPPWWTGLKFFNVYGPNEYHKGRMASVVFHAFHQISSTGRLRLFRSHRPDCEDGRQARDFVYVLDVVRVVRFLLETRPPPAIYNLGTGRARTFLDLGRSVFRAMGREPRIEFIDIPADIRDRYQYFTEAPMAKLRRAGYPGPFHSLEDGVAHYVQEFLTRGARLR